MRGLQAGDAENIDVCNACLRSATHAPGSEKAELGSLRLFKVLSNNKALEGLLTEVNVGSGLWLRMLVLGA